jgi:hypothetical protein
MEDGGAVLGVEGAEVQTGGGAKAEHEALVVEIGTGEILYIKLGRALLYPFEIGVKVTGIPLAGRAVVGVSAGSYSQIRSSVPITAVVTGVIAGTAEIGDLIMFKTGGEQMAAHAVIHGGAGVIIDRNDTVLPAKTVQRRALLIRQAVG